MKRRGSLIWIGLFLLAVVVGFVARPGRSDGVPLDPTSTAPDGGRAVRELLDRYADDVTTTGFDDSTDTVVVLRDPRASSVTDELDRWVRAGGSLLWLDENSTFGPLGGTASSVASGGTDRFERGTCSVEALGDLNALTAPDLRLLGTAPASAVCFATAQAGVSEGTAVIAQFGLDRGVVTVVGGSGLVDNEHLALADNAAMIVRLATAKEGRRVTIVHPSTLVYAATPDEAVGLFDLTPARVNVFLVQLFVAAALWLWFRGRRFGKVVTEAQLVEIPASLLVRSAAELQRRARGERWAANALRSDFIDRLRREHRIGPDATDETIVAAVSQRTGYPAPTLAAIVRPDGEIDLGDLVSWIDDASPHVFTQPPALTPGRQTSSSSGSVTP